VDRFRRRYGASPLHLVGLLASSTVAGYAAWLLVGTRPVAVVAWFVGAALVHDLVLAPIYLSLDRVGSAWGTRPWWWNHVRFPAAFSLLLLLVWAPEITRRSSAYYRAVTGLDDSVYLWRWLAVTGVLFVISGLMLFVRLLRRRSSRPVSLRRDDAGGA
jgi:hypothetical protein